MPARSRRTWILSGAIAMAAGILAVGLGLGCLAAMREIRHDGPRQAVNRDDPGGRIAVEMPDDGVWSGLVAMRLEGDSLRVDAIVERHDHACGFRFRPDTLNVSEASAEGLQAWIGAINEDLDSWLGGYAYVWASVVKIHGS